jgi:flavodoxin
MKAKKMLLIGAAAIIAVVIILFGAMAMVMFDVWSMTAGGSETLNPSGTATGKALVVYNPGISGGAKGIADTIASDLKADGYTVTLAGIKSSAASDAGAYNVIVVGGPIYVGNASGSIKAYLENLKPASDAKVGVFGFGSSEIDNSNRDAVLNDVASGAGNTLKIDAAMKFTGNDDKSKMCAEFVNALLG